MTRIDSDADLPNLSPDEAIFAKVFLKLKQRMNAQSSGQGLVSSLKVEKTDKLEPDYSVPRKTLTGHQKDVSDLLPNRFVDFLEYQLSGWDYIEGYFNGKHSEDLIISASTGFGKTESVLPAIVKRLINTDRLSIIAFPRRSLLLDQLKRIGEYNLGNAHLRIGIQMTGISSTSEYTFYSENQQGNIFIRGSNAKPHHIDPKYYTNYHFENDFVSVDFSNRGLDIATLKVAQCNNCGDELTARLDFQIMGTIQNRTQTYGRRGNASRFAGDSTTTTNWKCKNTSCQRKYTISLSREDHVAVRPNLIFTTIDSLSSLFSDPDLKVYFKDKLDAVILDEAHVYNGAYGSHASAILSELRSEIGRDFLKVGLSATIDSPKEFGEKLFRNQVNVISPGKRDINIKKDGETYYFLKSDNITNSSGEMRTLKSQAMIQFGIASISSIVGQDEKSLTFMDSIDAVETLRKQVSDAYEDPNKHLHTFRLDELIPPGIDYDGNTCSGLNPGICNLSCPIYDAGECWLILRNQQGVTTPTDADIISVWADTLPDRNVLENSSFIFSTSELQLGIDLPDIAHLSQYGTPYTIFDYIQRKGRAGRRIGSYPNFYFILGDKTNDYIYFSHGSNILNKNYQLPLNTENKVVNEIHTLLYKAFRDNLSEYARNTTPSPNLPYVKKFRSAWLASFKNSTSIFEDFLRNNFGIDSMTMTSVIQYGDMKSFKNDKATLVRESVQQLLDELNTLLLDHMTPIEYIELHSRELVNVIESSQLPDVEKETLIQELQRLQQEVINDSQAPDGTVPDATVLAHQTDFLNFLNRINVQYITTPIARKALEFYTKLASMVQNRTLAGTQQKIRYIFFKLQSLKELETALGRSLTSEIIKYFFRSQHFYEVAEVSSSQQYTQAHFTPLPPNTYFSSSSREVLIANRDNQRDSYTTDVRDSIFKFFPFRLIENGSEYYKTLSQPLVHGTGGTRTFRTTSFIDGISFHYDQNNLALMPLSLSIESVRDDGLNGVVSFCNHCFSIQNISSFRCSSCGTNLPKARIYAKRLVEVSIVDRGSKYNPIRGLSYSKDTDTSPILTGVSVDVAYHEYDGQISNYRPNGMRATYRLSADTPYGYMVNTHSIHIQVGREKIDALMSEFRNAYPNRLLSDEEILHTIAHLWIKTITLTTGISDEYFGYSFTIDEREKNGTINISELQEGGAGYLEVFVNKILNYTKDVYDNASTIVDCQENARDRVDSTTLQISTAMNQIDFINDLSLSKKSEIVDACVNILTGHQQGEIEAHFPACYDGCPYCLYLSSCNHGSEEQVDGLSLFVARKYLESLLMKTTDPKKASEAVERGGLLISNVGGEYGIFLL